MVYGDAGIEAILKELGGQEEDRVTLTMGTGKR